MKDNDELIGFVTQLPDVWVQDAIFKAIRHIEDSVKPLVAVSGGSDSDIMLDLLHNLDIDKKIVYVWCDTGLEYEATKRHLKELEEKYNIQIIPLKAKVPIPMAVRKYGVPFLSKQVSEYIMRLQKHNFQWEDEPFDVLYAKYPKCKGALRWWCNDFGENSKFNIAYNTYLKEFMIQNPPDFPISSKCCYFAKKSPVNSYVLSNGFDLTCTGVRKAERGIRASAYGSCFTPASVDGVAQYRPLFWFTKESKECYKKVQDITYSDCYEVWGLDRTGCAACPFGKNFEFELDCIEKYEPKLFRAVWKIFGKSYEYTRRYREFQQKMRESQ